MNNETLVEINNNRSGHEPAEDCIDEYEVNSIFRLPAVRTCFSVCGRQ